MEHGKANVLGKKPINNLRHTLIKYKPTRTRKKEKRRKTSDDN
jgi:hypothetical protein